MKMDIKDQLICNDTVQIELGSQYYFYLETQTALAVPDEDNCIVVYSSCQCPENAQEVIAKCLGIPDHNIRVITRRVGGGFGGKALRAIPVSIDVYGFQPRFSFEILLLFLSEENFLTFS